MADEPLRFEAKAIFLPSGDQAGSVSVAVPSVKFFASLPSDAAGVDDRRHNTVARLAHQLRGLGQGAQASLWPRLHELHVRAQLVVGGLDTKYTRLAVQMASEMQQARVSTVAGVGHAVHLERPDAVAHLLTS